MATGTVSMHSWNDTDSGTAASAEDEGFPPVGSNYNHSLEPRPDYDEAGGLHRRRTRGAAGSGREGLRSNVVRPRRFGQEGGGEGEGDDGGEDGRAGW